MKPARSLGPQASAAFLMAAGAVTGMLGLMVIDPEGVGAVSVIAGFPGVEVSDAALRRAIFLDTLLPLGFGAGFSLLAADRWSDQPALSAGALVFTVMGTGADFLENGSAVFATAIPALTVIKYGALGVASMLLAPLLGRETPVRQAATIMLQWGVPLTMALFISGLLGAATVWVFAFALIPSFLLGALAVRPLPEEAAQ